MTTSRELTAEDHTKRRIDGWLQERQTLLGLFYRLLKLKPFDDETPDADLLKEFCQILIDYTSAGHFEIFQLIATNNIENSTLKRISVSTDIFTTFNNKFSKKNFDTNELELELSLLGEELAKRMDLEDHLICKYLQKYNAQVE